MLHTIFKFLNKYTVVLYGILRRGGAGIFVFVVLFFGILNTVVQYIPLSLVTGLMFTVIQAL